LASTDPRAYWILFFLISVSGCLSQPPIVSLTQFPAFAVADGPDITPTPRHDAIHVVDVLALNDRMRQVLDGLITSAKYPKQRLESFLDIIHNNGLFRDIDDKRHTKTAIETFESGTGNCLSYSNTFVAMARYVGLDAFFQDVEIHPTWDKYGEILFYNRHVSVGVQVAIGKTYEIDFHQRHRFRHQTGHPTAQRISDDRAISQYHNNIGSEHLVSGNITAAFQSFIRALTLDPELSYVWSNLGSVYNRNNQTAAAEKAYRQAIAINRSEYTAMSNLVRLYDKLGRKNEANAYRTKVRAFRNRNPYYHYAIGERALGENRYGESIRHLKKAIYQKPNEHYFYFALAHAYLRSGDRHNAEKNFAEAKALAPDEQTKDRYIEEWAALAKRPDDSVLH